MLKEVILLPVGSYEYHGDILPYNTDAIIAENIARDVSKKISNSYVLPLLNYGVSPEHADFEYTCSIRSIHYYRFIYDIAESICKDGRFIVVINGHGGNNCILSSVESDFNYEHPNSKIYLCPLFTDDVKDMSKKLLGEFDSHAGSFESSLLSYYGTIDNITHKSIKDDDFIKDVPHSLRFFRNRELGESGVIKKTNSIIIDYRAGKKLHNLIVSGTVNNIQTTKKYLNRQLNRIKNT